MNWDDGAAYDLFMGRWSIQVAREFVPRLGQPPGIRWLDVGCGTGALTEAILANAAPSSVEGVDPSPGFVAVAQGRLGDSTSIMVGWGDDLPHRDRSVDVVVSGLALNFMPDPVTALAEWRRVARPGGVVAVYVWDYAQGMGFLRTFWDEVKAMDPRGADLDEGERFTICRPGALQAAFEDAGLIEIETGALEIPTRFADFDDYWAPFFSGQGPAPGYVAALDGGTREQLAARLRQKLPFADDGTIALSARAWTACARAPS